MPKKKAVSQEELEQATAELPEQTVGAAVPPETETPDDGLPIEGQEAETAPPLPDDAPDEMGEDTGNTPELMNAAFMGVLGETPEDIHGNDPAESSPLEDLPPAEKLPPSPEPSAGKTPPMTDRQSFFALDFRELDRDLTPEERQAWNSIYASFRGHSALSGKIIGADPHSMNVRNKETGKVERRTMYCVVVLLYRVPVYIPATEMWTGEARPDYVLRNMMGADIDFIITKVDREGGYAIASRRQAARAQRYFFAHRPDLCRAGSRTKCRMLAVGPRRCLVECYGHDMDLTQRELSYTAIADLRDKYHPGDELDCIVKEYEPVFISV